MVNYLHGNIVFLGALQAVSFLIVRNYGAYLEIGCRACIDKCLQVGAATGDQNYYMTVTRVVHSA